MDRVKDTLNQILEVFQSGNIPEKIAHASFQAKDIPSNKWSFLNKIIMLCADTEDLRGYNQWKEVNRFVKKGAKAVWILAPRMKKEKDKNGDENFHLIGFLSIPVYRYEDTEGREVDYKLLELPEFSLLERAKEFGLDVRAVPFNNNYWGAYNQKKGTIELATPEEQVFCHELSHHAHKLIKGELKPGQIPLQEVVAELSASALMYIIGKEPKTGNTYRYIENYCKECNPPISPISGCILVLGEVEKVIKLILGEETKQEELAL